MRTPAKKIIAILLLFLFIEKAGVRLWIHTHYHINTAWQAPSKNKVPLQTVSKEDCDCLDDFFIPLTFTNEISVSVPAIDYCDQFNIYYKSFISSLTLFSVQLRGPPAIG
jgi:hypothetical protein